MSKTSAKDAAAVEAITWKVAVHSTRGASHLRSGLPNQDACEFWIDDAHGGSRAVLAIADGHGGARHFRSDTGSHLAVVAAISGMQRLMADREYTSHDQLGSEFQKLPRQIVEEWRAAVANHFSQYPFTEEELSRVEPETPEARATVLENPALAYGSTLIVAATHEHWIFYLQIGDGDILTVDDAGNTVRPLPEDSRLMANQTTSICQPEAWNDFRLRFSTERDHAPALILLSTDGYSNSFRSEADFLQIGKDYLELVREKGLSELSHELPSILEEASQQGSGDDITFGLLKRNGQLTNQGAHAPVAEAVPAPAAAPRPPGQEARQPRSSEQSVRTLKANYAGAQRSVRKLQVALAVAVVAFVTLAIVHYGKRWSPIDVAVGGAKPSDKPVKTSPVAHSWALHLHSGHDLPLKTGTTITSADLEFSGKNSDPADIAKVVDSGDTPGLQNISSLKWDVKTADGDKLTIAKDEIVPLQDKTQINFGPLSIMVVEVTHSKAHVTAEQRATGKRRGRQP